MSFYQSREVQQTRPNNLISQPKSILLSSQALDRNTNGIRKAIKKAFPFFLAAFLDLLHQRYSAPEKTIYL